MKAFRERFREESWFQKPQERSWASVEKALVTFCKNDLKKVGGKITKETSKRNFERFKIAYQSLFFQVINEFLKRDVGVKMDFLQLWELGQPHWAKDMYSG